MTLNVALIVDNENGRKRLLEFASSQHWRVAEELPVQATVGNLRDASLRFDAVVAYRCTGDHVDVFEVRYCGGRKI
jgi:hypothetical protein